MMDDGEVNSPNSRSGLLDLQSDDYSYMLDDSSIIMENDWETLIGTQICSHKHICNPTTGPDNTHTHTCEHYHTQTIGGGHEEALLTKKRRPSGNKEAVRKYREKQKAVKVNLEVRNAELEKENRRIPELQKENLRLRRKLQEQVPRQDALEILIAENKRLRALLSQLRREIDLELDEGAGYQKFLLNPTKSGPSTTCAAPVPCFLPGRPVATAAAHAGLTDLERVESPGWHAECELGNNTVVCHSHESEDADVVTTDQCTSFGPPPSVSTRQRVVAPSKAASVAATRRRNNSLLRTVPHKGGVSCVASVLCSHESAARASSPIRPQNDNDADQSWKGVCGEFVSVTCEVSEMTPDSSRHSAPLSPAEDGTPCAAASTHQEAPTSSNLGAADIFRQGNYIADEPPSLPACWNDPHSSAAGTGAWLENGNPINGSSLLEAALVTSFGTPK